MRQHGLAAGCSRLKDGGHVTANLEFVSKIYAHCGSSTLPARVLSPEVYANALPMPLPSLGRLDAPMPKAEPIPAARPSASQEAALHDRSGSSSSDYWTITDLKMQSCYLIEFLAKILKLLVGTTGFEPATPTPPV